MVGMIRLYKQINQIHIQQSNLRMNESKTIEIETPLSPSTNTDKNIFDKSYQLVTHFPDFPLWENRIAHFK